MYSAIMCVHPIRRVMVWAWAASRALAGVSSKLYSSPTVNLDKDRCFPSLVDHSGEKTKQFAYDCRTGMVEDVFFEGAGVKNRDSLVKKDEKLLLQSHGEGVETIIQRNEMHRQLGDEVGLLSSEKRCLLLRRRKKTQVLAGDLP
jgi:hypothetical protein